MMISFPVPSWLARIVSRKAAAAEAAIAAGHARHIRIGFWPFAWLEVSAAPQHQDQDLAMLRRESPRG